MSESANKDIKHLISICEVGLYGGDSLNTFFTECRIEASKNSECVNIKVKGTNSVIKIKKTALLKIMGYSQVDHTKYRERI